MNAVSVFTPAARTTDPATSHFAADHVTHTGLRAHQQRQVASAVRQWPGCTSYELSEHMCADRVMPARRLRELVTAGEVREGPRRKCEISGRLAITWLPANPGDQFELPVAA